MRLVIDLPEWAQERHIYVLAGIEMVAYKLYDSDIVNIKTVRCNMCGDCCKGIKPGAGVPIGADGNCVHLEQIGNLWECKLGARRPFWCCTGLEQKGRLRNLDCVIEYRQEKL